MKKAVIATGGKQYLVKEGDLISVELLKDTKNSNFTPLMVIDGDKTIVGKPELTSSKVTAEIIKEDEKADKVTSIRYKAKKRVKKIRGHRQRQATLKIKKIS